jgi:hypothetical protein
MTARRKSRTVKDDDGDKKIELRPSHRANAEKSVRRFVRRRKNKN